MSGTTKRRVYIAGPMTGIANFNIEAFNDAEKMLKGSGYDVINPAGLFGRLARAISSKEEVINQFYQLPIGSHAKAMIDMELALLRTCDAIYLLRGWRNSRGAKRELKEAIDNGLDILEERKS